MKPILNIALRAARKAGSFLVYERDRLDLHSKPNGLEDLLFQAEVQLCESISKMCPEHLIVSTTPDFTTIEQDIVWQIEIVSGRENFIRNIPHYTISLVIYEAKIPQHTLIYDPNCEEFFVASAGAGAKVNDYRIRVTNGTSLAGALFMTTANYDQSTQIKKLREQGATFYFAGCTILALAYVAAGRADAFCGSDLTQLELAAASLLLQESGALIGDLQGAHDYFTKQELLAANAKLFKLCLQAIKKTE